MKKIYCPWRSEYSEQVALHKKENSSAEECVFCELIKQNKDKENFIIARGTHCTIFLNKYPYNAGHILILPNNHVSQLGQLTPEVYMELMQLLVKSEKIMRDTLGAHGVNMGVNLGKAAGAGIPSHLHFHVLPRWQGDTNFLPTLGDTKQISFDLHEMYDKIAKAFKE